MKDMKHGEGKVTDDASFLKEMTAHHEAALVMAQAVLATTSNSAIKKLATKIVNTQSAEITLMKSLGKKTDSASLATSASEFLRF